MQIDNEENEQLLAAAVSEIERFRTLDCVIPTYHNIVTVSCIKVKGMDIYITILKMLSILCVSRILDNLHRNTKIYIYHTYF